MNYTNGTSAGRVAWLELVYAPAGVRPTLHRADVDCSTRELETPYAKFVYVCVAPGIILAGVLGNALSAAIYGHKFLRNSPTIRLLTYKAVAGLLYLLSMVHMSLYHTIYGYNETNVFEVDADRTASIYWNNLPWTLFLTNTLSTITVWLSVCVTAEHFLLVTMPIRCRDLLTMWRATGLSVVMVLLSVLLHLYHVTCMTVVPVPCGRRAQHVKYFYVPAYRTTPQAVHYVYYIAEMTLTVAVPMLLMVVFSAGLYYKLVMGGPFKQTLNEQKRCVLCLAVSTAGCHLALETPQALVLLAAAVGGNTRRWWTAHAMALLRATAVALGMAHAAVPFFIYLLLSNRFRSIFVSTLVPCARPPTVEQYALNHTTIGKGRTHNNNNDDNDHDEHHEVDAVGKLHAGRNRAQSEPMAKVDRYLRQVDSLVGALLPPTIEERGESNSSMTHHDTSVDL